MTGADYPDCPEAVRSQLAGFVAAAQQILSGNLTGVYLHGSLALGCFNPQRSDVDLLIATIDSLDVDTRRDMGECLLELSGQPSPIEISILTAEDRRMWRHPLPYDFHYSEDWRDRITRELADGAWRYWRHADRGDVDLAAHLTILHTRGIVLVGDPIAAVFPAVPREDYLDSILADVDDDSIRHNVEHNPVYIILNLCRVYAYVRDGLITSKDEAGAWALGVLSAELRPLVEHALAIYRAAAPEDKWDRSELLKVTAAIRRMTDRDVQSDT